jgi:putative membrane protein
MISTRIDNRILFCTALTLFASLTALGQNSNGLPRLGSTDSDAKGAHSFADQAFVKSVMERDAAEEQLGQLAQQKSQSDDVKQLGQKTAEDRTLLDSRFKVLAKSLEVGEPKGPSKKDKQLIASLQGLSGARFDEEYIKAIDKAHKQDIKDIQIEVQSTQDPNVQQAAQQSASILSQRLQAIEQVAQAHSVAIDAKQ